MPPWTIPLYPYHSTEVDRARDVPMESLSIGQVAEAAGVGVETVRFYQRQGLIEEPSRQGTRHRRYPQETVARIRFIRGAQELGFSLKEIEELMALRIAPGTSKSEIRARAQAKVDEIQEKMRDLQRMRDALLKLIGSCEGTGTVEDCPILAAFDRGPSRDPPTSVDGSASLRGLGGGAGPRGDPPRK